MKTLICVAALGLSTFAFFSSPADPQEARLHEVGRYQLQVPDKSRTYLIDTKTGQVWLSYTGNAWKEAHGPVTAKMAEAPAK